MWHVSGVAKAKKSGALPASAFPRLRVMCGRNVVLGPGRVQLLELVAETGSLRAAAARMFARWSQEDFLKYMRQHYALDHLLRHAVAPLPATTRVVNPAWRALERQRRYLTTQRQRQLVEFGSLCHRLHAPAGGRPQAARLLGGHDERGVP